MPKEPKQKDLEGGEPHKGVTAEEHTTVTERFYHRHFWLSIGAKALSDIQDLEDPVVRRKKLFKKVKALPDVEDIPKGAKDEEADVLIAAALATNVRGKF